jgi:CRP-like cAMP-binding protein
VRAGEEIYAQGSPSDTLFVVGRGRLNVLTTEDDGEPRTVSSVVPGQVLAIDSFTRQAAHSTSARAGADTVIFKLTRPVYDALVGPATSRQV